MDEDLPAGRFIPNDSKAVFFSYLPARAARHCDGRAATPSARNELAQ